MFTGGGDGVCVVMKLYCSDEFVIGRCEELAVGVCWKEAIAGRARQARPALKSSIGKWP